MFFVPEPFENPISEIVLFAYFPLNHRKTLWGHDFKNLSDSKNIDSGVRSVSLEVRSVSLEVRSDAVLGVVLWLVWFCMSLNTRTALWKSMWLVKQTGEKRGKQDFLVNSRFFVKAITLWQYFYSTKTKNVGKSFSHCLELWSTTLNTRNFMKMLGFHDISQP